MSLRDKDLAAEHGSYNLKYFGIKPQEYGHTTKWATAIAAAKADKRDLFGVGNFILEGQLIWDAGVRLRGPLHGPGCSLFWYYNGTDIPLIFDGTEVSGGWVYNAGFENVYLDAYNWVGGANDYFMDLVQCYSVEFKGSSIDNCPTGKTPMRVSYVNDVTFDRFRIVGSATRPAHVLVDSATGEVNGIRFQKCDFEEGASKGIHFTGSTNSITAEVIGHYSEATDTNIYWDAGAAESGLVVMGGHLEAKDASSIGVDIRRSNCTVLGMNFVNGGAYSVDIDNATSWNNCHVIGGSLYSAVRDTNRRLSTNTKGTITGSATYDPGTVSDTFGAATSFTVNGAALGDFVDVAFSLNLAGVLMTGYVSAANTVSVRFQNETGSSWTPGSGTVYARVRK